MPFAATNRPSLGLGLLQAELARRGIGCDVYFPNVWFAELVESPVLVGLVSGYPDNRYLLGEWLFSRALWGESADRDRAYLDLLRGFGHEVEEDRLLGRLVECRRLIEPFLERCLAEIPWSRYRLVGFTSMFQQQLASLALARRLAARWPDLVIAIGGANCEGGMGRALFEEFDFLDVVCSGEGDEVFPELAEAILEGRPAPHRLGILHRSKSKSPDSNLQPPAAEIAPLVRDLDALPFPDFDDYFAALDAARLPADHDPPRLLFETSRGCWWGEKSHCTFCGLNGLGMSFRRKSPERVLAELEALVGRYGERTRAASATDNILPPEYFMSLFPRLAERRLGLELFFETKTHLNEEQVLLLRRAGVRILQPGIESLSTAALGRMAKGNHRLQNVQILKWCLQYGIEVYWSYLTGFPGESEGELAEVPSLAGLLSHLPPPSGLRAIHFDRFSPYAEEPERYGLLDLQPVAAYRLVYPGLSDASLHRLAYFFAATDPADSVPPEVRAEADRAIEQWRAAAKGRALFSMPFRDGTLVCDFRSPAAPRLIALSGEYARWVEECRQIRPISRLFGETGRDRAEEKLQRLLDLGLILREGNYVLSLAVPLGEFYSPPAAVVARMKEFQERLRSGAVDPEPADGERLWIRLDD